MASHSQSEIEPVAAAHASPGVDELGTRHLIEKTPPRSPVLPREERQGVRRTDGDAEHEVEGKEALLEEDVERACGEDAAHGAALDDQRDAGRGANGHVRYAL